MASVFFRIYYINFIVTSRRRILLFFNPNLIFYDAIHLFFSNQISIRVVVGERFTSVREKRETLSVFTVTESETRWCLMCGKRLSAVSGERDYFHSPITPWTVAFLPCRALVPHS